jgi:hypothetical protein
MLTERESVASNVTIEAYDKYAEWTDEVAQYPVTAEAFYLALGIADEGGELTVAQSKGVNEYILAEAGDVCWYLARYLTKVLKVSFGKSVMTAGRLRADGFHRITGPRFALEHVGIIAGIEKKRVRDGANWDERKLFEKERAATDSALALISWLEEGLRTRGLSLSQAIVYNKSKLSKHLDEGTIKGDGDHR